MNLNSNEQLKILLLKEKELENTKTSIEKYKEELKQNKKNSTQAEIINGVIYTLDIIFFILGFSIIPLHILFVFIFISHLLLKYINISSYGTKIGRGLERHTLENILKTLEELVITLEKQISECKKNNNFIVVDEINALSNPQIISYENQFENNITYEEKPKVLTIGQKKNEK